MKHFKLLKSLLLALIATMLPQLASAYDFMVDGLCYNYNSDGTSVSVTYEIQPVISTSSSQRVASYSNIDLSLIIPQNVTFDGTLYNVTAIGDSAFASCNIYRVLINDNIQIIGDEAFSYCDLRDIVIGQSVQTIGDHAFYHRFSPRNKKITFYSRLQDPSSVAMGEQVFPNALNSINYKKYYSLYVPSGTEETYSQADQWNLFTQIYPLTDDDTSPIISFSDETVKNLCILNWDTNRDMELSENEAAAVNSLGDAFKGKTNITSFDELVYFKGLQTLEGFEGCSNLASVVLPDSISAIGNSAFRGCSSLTDINLPDGVTSIGEYAFEGCSGLTSVTIPNSVTSIGDRAFYGCSGLTSVTIGNSVTSIGENAFYGCTGLTKVNINSLEAWCNIDFGGWDANPLSYALNLYLNGSVITNLVIPNSVTSIPSYCFSGCTGLTSVDIPNSVTSIGYGAFYGCTGLTSVDIPNSVTQIGDLAFANCNALTSLVVEDGNPSYDSRNSCNAIIETETNTLIAGCMNTIIPNSVTSIGYGAFNGCTGLTSVTIPNSVTSIGECAFLWCNGLTSLDIPNSITEIGEFAFQNCRNLTSINLPNSLTTIAGYSFSLCPKLQEITIPSSVTAIEAFAFWQDSCLTAVSIPNSVTSIGGSAFIECTGLTSIVVESGNTKYDSRNSCNAIIETETNTLIAGCMNSTIPNSVTSIGGRAFEGCTGLTSVTIPNSVTSIGWHAFAGCTGLKSVVIPNSVESLDYMQFRGCTNLETLSLPNSLDTLSTMAFFECTSIKKIISHIQDPSTVCYLRWMANDLIINNFDGLDKDNCTLYVPKGTVEQYQSHEQWSGFVNIVELEYGDVDGDGHVSSVDVTAIYNYLLNGDDSAIINGDVDGDGHITSVDITAVYNLLLGN